MPEWCLCMIRFPRTARLASQMPFGIKFMSKNRFDCVCFISRFVNKLPVMLQKNVPRTRFQYQFVFSTNRFKDGGLFTSLGYISQIRPKSKRQITCRVSVVSRFIGRRFLQTGADFYFLTFYVLVTAPLPFLFVYIDILLHFHEHFIVVYIVFTVLLTLF